MQSRRQYHTMVGLMEADMIEQEDGSWLLKVTDSVTWAFRQKRFEDEETCRFAFDTYVETGKLPEAMQCGDEVIAQAVADNPFPGATLPWQCPRRTGDERVWRLSIGSILYYMDVARDGAILGLRRGFDTRLLNPEDDRVTIAEVEDLVRRQMDEMVSAWQGMSVSQSDER